MANLHELATTLGNSWILCSLGALAAGLAAFALMNGAAQLKRSQLPKNFPADPEACLDKYARSFSQLDQVNKGRDDSAGIGTIIELAEQLKNQPASHLCLTAFDQATDGRIGRGNK